MTASPETDIQKINNLLSNCIHHIIEIDPTITLENLIFSLTKKSPDLANNPIFVQIITILYDTEKAKCLNQF